jgi:hypothetical protein
MDDIEFHLDAFELSPTGQWAPFKATDLQLEFTKLDPHYRVNLK